MDDRKRRVGLFGGSFNPPHICHLLSSVFLLEGKTVDEVWWLPVHHHAFAKDRELAPWDQRLAMCKAAAGCYPEVHVSDIEARLQPPSFTFDTVAALRKEHPDTDFSWVIGSDLLDDLPRWHRWNELRESLDFLVVQRGEQTHPDPEGGRFERVGFTLPDVSSTRIRELAAAGDIPGLRPLVPAVITDYIADHPELYR